MRSPNQISCSRRTLTQKNHGRSWEGVGVLRRKSWTRGDNAGWDVRALSLNFLPFSIWFAAMHWRFAPLPSLGHLSTPFILSKNPEQFLTMFLQDPKDTNTTHWDTYTSQCINQPKTGPKNLPHIDTSKQKLKQAECILAVIICEERWVVGEFKMIEKKTHTQKQEREGVINVFSHF